MNARLHLRNCFFLFLSFHLLLACGQKENKSTTNPDPTTNSPEITTIAFGSCSRESSPQEMWPFVLNQKPDLWIWLGDNIYGDSEDMTVLKAKYDRQKSEANYQKLRNSTEIIGIWDDHFSCKKTI